jgi:hypothetical protein
MPFYKIIRTHCKQDGLFTSNTNWNCIVVLVQIRANIPSIKYKNKRVTFNAIKTYFGNNFQDTNDVYCLFSQHIRDPVSRDF